MFNNNVYLIGDCNTEMIEIKEKDLENPDLLQQICMDKLKEMINQEQGVIQTKDKIVKKI